MQSQRRTAPATLHHPQQGNFAAFSADAAQLERLAALGAHSAGLAHELKNAFVPIKSIIQILRERHPQDELCELACRELSRVDSLLGQMLHLGSPSRAGLQELSVHEVLAYSLRLLQPQLTTKRITVRTHWNAAPDHINGSEHQLQQAIMNLVLNALEAMTAGGTLTIRTEHQSVSGAPALAVRITDTGCGIPPEVLSRLFTPFFSTKADGTGLGLHITRRIIEGHQGSIAAESLPGQGTTFTITLPLSEPLPGN